VKVAVFSAKNYDREFLTPVNASRHELHFFEVHLSEQTAGLAAGFPAFCVFVNDNVDARVVAKLASLGGEDRFRIGTGNFAHRNPADNLPRVDRS
jgi:D-lactate dehydrogenase